MPTTVTEVRVYLGFVNYYRIFLTGYGDVVRTLNALLKKESEFFFTDECKEAFERTKAAALEEPVLKIPDRPFEVETDASNWAIGGQLGQRDDKGKLHPCAFFSRALRGPELNYPIHDKELMSIIFAFKEWKPWLIGTNYEVQVYTDRKTLTYFTTSKELNGRQTRWCEFLAPFNYKIHYRKGSDNGRADALSRRGDLKPKEEPEPTTMMKSEGDGTITHHPYLAK